LKTNDQKSVCLDLEYWPKVGLSVCADNKSRAGGQFGHKNLYSGAIAWINEFAHLKIALRKNKMRSLFQTQSYALRHLRSPRLGQNKSMPGTNVSSTSPKNAPCSATLLCGTVFTSEQPFPRFPNSRSRREDGSYTLDGILSITLAFSKSLFLGS
jgi:hypothetical protein